MYTFVYRTFIKFILFCRGQALDASKWHCRMPLLLLVDIFSCLVEGYLLDKLKVVILSVYRSYILFYKKTVFHRSGALLSF